MGLIVSSKRWHLLLFIRSSNPNKGKTTRTKKNLFEISRYVPYHSLVLFFIFRS